MALPMLLFGPSCSFYFRKSQYTVVFVSGVNWKLLYGNDFCHHNKVSISQTFIGMSGQGDVQQPSSPAEKDKVPSRVLISESEIASLTPTEWVNRWHQQDSYIATLERKLNLQEGT